MPSNNAAYPCRDCPNKGCGSFHSQCEPYQAAIKQSNIIKRAINKNKEIYGYAHKNHERIEKYMRRH